MLFNRVLWDITAVVTCTFLLAFFLCVVVITIFFKHKVATGFTVCVCEIMCGYCRCVRCTGMLTCFRYDATCVCVCDKCSKSISGAAECKSQRSVWAGMPAPSGLFSMAAGFC